MNEKLRYVTDILMKINEKEYIKLRELFFKMGWTEKELREADEWYATKDYVLSATSVANGSIIEKLYEDEIDKISHILNNEELLEKINGLKIMFHGDTGTGKTSLVKKIANLNQNISIEDMNIEKLVSPKLGQTQINLIELANKLNAENKGKKIIIFFDEIDSIINNRTEDNDVAEHSRIVSTFIKFMDMLDKNIIVFAATNLIKKIDIAIQRRFNIIVPGKKFSAKEFVEYFNFENSGNPISIRLFNSTIKETDASFSLSELNAFQEHLVIEESLRGKVEPLSMLIVYFKDKIKVDSENLSRRMIASVKRIEK